MHHLFLLLRCQACPSLSVAQSGGGDGFFFRPSMIPVLDVVRLWSPIASASGSVALSGTVIISIILLCYVICVRGRSGFLEIVFVGQCEVLVCL